MIEREVPLVVEVNIGLKPKSVHQYSDPDKSLRL